MAPSVGEGAMLRSVLENINEGVCLLNEGLRYQMFNEKYVELLGLEPGSIQVGDSLIDVTRILAERGYFKGGSVAQSVERNRQAFGAKTPSEWILVTPDGRHLNVHLSPIRDGGMTVRVSDITRQKYAEAAMRLKERQLHKALDNIEGAVLMYDKDLILQVFSQRYLEIAELPDGLFVVGDSIMKNLRFRAKRGDYGDGDPEKLMQERVDFLKNIETDFYQEQAMGSRICEVFWKRDSDGDLISVTNDITERKVTEMMLKLAKEEAFAASSAKSEFLANMSHELRTPLNAVIGFSEALAVGIAGPMNEKQSGYVSDIRVSGDHLLALISDVLDLAKIESGKLDIEETEFDLLELINTTLPFVRGRAAESGIELVTDFPSDFPPIRADVRLIKQIVVNLLSNAVKFTPDGGRVSVAASADTVHGIVLTVADTGASMAAEEIPKALEHFVRTRSGRGKEGTGLGLPLVKNMCEIHGGYLNITSSVGVGTTVTVTLPASRIIDRR